MSDYAPRDRVEGIEAVGVYRDGEEEGRSSISSLFHDVLAPHYEYQELRNKDDAELLRQGRNPVGRIGRPRIGADDNVEMLKRRWQRRRTGDYKDYFIDVEDAEEGTLRFHVNVRSDDISIDQHGTPHSILWLEHYHDDYDDDDRVKYRMTARALREYDIDVIGDNFPLEVGKYGEDGDADYWYIPESSLIAGAVSGIDDELEERGREIGKAVPPLSRSQTLFVDMDENPRWDYIDSEVYVFNSVDPFLFSGGLTEAEVTQMARREATDIQMGLDKRYHRIPSESVLDPEGYVANIDPELPLWSDDPRMAEQEWPNLHSEVEDARQMVRAGMTGMQQLDGMSAEEDTSTIDARLQWWDEEFEETRQELGDITELVQRWVPQDEPWEHVPEGRKIGPVSSDQL